MCFHTICFCFPPPRDYNLLCDRTYNSESLPLWRTGVPVVPIPDIQPLGLPRVGVPACRIEFSSQNFWRKNNNNNQALTEKKGQDRQVPLNLSKSLLFQTSSCYLRTPTKISRSPLLPLSPCLFLGGTGEGVLPTALASTSNMIMILPYPIPYKTFSRTNRPLWEPSPTPPPTGPANTFPYHTSPSDTIPSFHSTTQSAVYNNKTSHSNSPPSPFLHPCFSLLHNPPPPPTTTPVI